MAMTAAGMPRHIFLKRPDFQHVDIFRNGPCLSLKCPDTRSVQLMQRPAADTANDNRIHVVPAEACNRIARAVLMNLVAVAYRLKRAGCHINNHKFRS